MPTGAVGIIESYLPCFARQLKEQDAAARRAHRRLERKRAGGPRRLAMEQTYTCALKRSLADRAGDGGAAGGLVNSTTIVRKSRLLESVSGILGVPLYIMRGNAFTLYTAIRDSVNKHYRYPWPLVAFNSSHP